MKLLKNIFKKTQPTEDPIRFAGTDCGCLTYDRHTDVPKEASWSVIRDGDVCIVTMAIKNKAPSELYNEICSIGAKIATSRDDCCDL